MAKVMVSRNAYSKKNIVPWSIEFKEFDLTPREILDRAMSGKIMSEVFFVRSNEDFLLNSHGRRTQQTYVGTQCIFFDFDDASCGLEEFVSKLSRKPTFGYATLSDGKEEDGKVWHKFRLGYVLSDFVYGLDNRNKVWMDIAKENKFLPTGKGEQDKTDMKCSPVQWFFGTKENADNVFFPENIFEVQPEIRGFRKSYEEYEALRNRSEKEYEEKRRKIEGNKNFWDDESMSGIYKRVLNGEGWKVDDDIEGLEKMPSFDVTITGRMMAKPEPMLDKNGNVERDENGDVKYQLRRDRKGNIKTKKKYQPVKFRDGEHRRCKLYIACQKMKENYLKLREKYNYTPQLTPTILFYFLHFFAVKFFELNSKGDIINSGDIANIALDVFDDDRDISFFDRKKKSKRRAIYLPTSGRFPLEARKSQITAAITAQFRLYDILSQYDWSKSPADNIECLNGAEKGKLYAGRKLSEESLIELFNDVREVLEGDGRYCTKAGLLIYDFNNYKSIDKYIIDSFINYFDFSFSSFFKVVKDNGTRPVRKGEKTRMVLEALKGMEITSARKMQKVLEERGIEVSTRTLAYAIKSLKGDVNNRNSFRTCAKSNAQSNYNYIDNNIVRSHTEIAQSGKNVRKDYKVLEGLSKGITISEIAAETGVNEKTIRRYIKKAKDSGIIRNEGTRKFPKWVMTSENVLPESLDSISKEKEIIKEEIKEKTIKDMNTNDYNFDEFLNDVMPSTPTVPDIDFGNCVSDYSSAVTQSSPTVSVAMPEEAEVEAIDEEFKAKAKTVFNDNLNEPSATEDDLPEDMPEDMMNITMDIKPVKAMRYISNRDEPDTGVIPTEEQRKELRGKLAAIIARYDSDVEGVVRKCKGFYFSFSLLVSGNDMYRNNPWRKSMEDEMNCSDILIGQLFLELKSEVVVTA